MTEQAIDFNVAIGFDDVGDPMMRFEMSAAMDPDAVMRPEQVRTLGVLFIEAAARAEAGAKLSRQMLLDGAPQELVTLVVSKMMT
jgi:hypothetical protein